MHALVVSLISLVLMTPLTGGWLGVYLAANAKQAVVTEVIPGTPAHKAGLKAGDVLLALDKKDLPTRDEFLAAMKKCSSGQRVKIRLRRDRRERSVVVRLGERPESIGAGTVATPQATSSPRKPAPQGASPSAETSKVRRQEKVAPADQAYLGLSIMDSEGGVVVDRVLANGPCAKAKIQRGDRITSLGDHRVQSLKDLDRALGNFRVGQRTSIGGVRAGSRFSAPVTFSRQPAKIKIPVSVIEEVGADKVRPRVREQASQEVLRDLVEVPSEAIRVNKSVRIPDDGKAAALAARRQGSSSRGGAAGGQQKPPSNSLENELVELRSELKELRRMLEQIKAAKIGRE